MHPDVEIPYVIAEILGRNKPEGIVVVSGHLDSIDVGQGAQDAGVVGSLRTQGAISTHPAPFTTCIFT